MRESPARYPFMLLKDLLFVLLLLNMPVISYGHVRTVASDFVGLVPDIGMNDTCFSSLFHVYYRVGRLPQHQKLNQNVHFLCDFCAISWGCKAHKATASHPRCSYH